MRSPMASCAGMRAICSASPRRHSLSTMRCSGIAVASCYKWSSGVWLCLISIWELTSFLITCLFASFVDVSGVGLIGGHVVIELASMRGAVVLIKVHVVPGAELHAAFGDW